MSQSPVAATAPGLALGIAYGTSVASVSGVSLIYPVLPAIAASLSVGESAIGLVIAAYTLPAVVLAPVFGVVADLHGRRWLLILGLALFAIAGAAVSLAPGFGWLLALRAIQGIGVSALTPLTIVLISDLLPPERELRGQGHKVVIDRVGMISLPILGGALATIDWHLAPLVYLAALPLAVAAWAWMPETKPPGKVEAGSYMRETWAATALPKVRLGIAVGFLRFLLDYGLFIYLPLLMALRLGASATTIGVVLAVSAVGAIVTAATVTRIAQIASVEALLAVAFLVSALGLGAMIVDRSLWTISAGAFAFGLGNGLISPLQKSLLTRGAPKHLRGGVISIDRVVQQIAKSLAPAVLGLLLLVARLEAVLVALGLAALLGAGLLAVAEARGRAARRVPT